MAHYRLLGSLTSPYVRRLRLYLEGVKHEFDALKDMTGATTSPFRRSTR